MKRIIVVSVVSFLVLVGAGIVVIVREPNEEIACTADAKMCPDGSAVGRVGPMCEFAECSTVVAEFSREGILTTITIGEKMNVPYLVYKESASSSHSQKLVFDERADIAPSTISSLVGARVRVDGIYDGVLVSVHSLTVLEKEHDTEDGVNVFAVALKERASALGIVVTPQEIVEDSRCPKGVQCIWAGTVRVKVLVNDGTKESTKVFSLNEPMVTSLGEVTLTSVEPYPISGEEINVDAYVCTFEIKGKENVAPSVQTAVIRGKVNIGPICPVEQEGVPCVISPEVYTSREIVIYRTDGVTEVAHKAIGASGTYSLSLPAGSYVLDLVKTGMDNSADVPHPFTLSGGETGYFDLSIDTGIR